MRLLESIFLFISFEISHEGSRVACSRFPDLSLTDFIQQEPVVVFLDEVLEFLVLCGKAVGSVVHHLLNGAARLFGQTVHQFIGNLVFDAALLQELQDAWCQRVIRFQGAFAHQFHDVPSDIREDRCARLSDLQGIGSVFNLLQQLVRTNPSDDAAAHSRSLVIRSLGSQLCEVCTAFQRLVDAVDACLGRCLLFGCGLLCQTHIDVSRLDELFAFKLCQHLVVIGTHFLFFGFGRDQQWSDLLVAIAAELFLVGGERVQVSIECGTDFQFIIDKEVGILLDGLLVDDAVRIVLVE